MKSEEWKAVIHSSLFALLLHGDSLKERPRHYLIELHYIGHRNKFRLIRRVIKLWQGIWYEFQETFLLTALDDFHRANLIFGNHPIEFVGRKVCLPVLYTFQPYNRTTTDTSGDGVPYEVTSEISPIKVRRADDKEGLDCEKSSSVDQPPAKSTS